jgi:Domain of unknown function (DUF4347)/Bacterial Ig domain
LRASEKGSSDQQAHSKNQKRRRNRRTIGFMPLEPRIMYDGAAAATAAVAHHHADHHDVATGNSPMGGAPSTGPMGGAPAGGAPAAGDWSHGQWNGHWSGEVGKTANIATESSGGGNTMAPTVPSITHDPSSGIATAVTSLADRQPVTEVVFVDSDVPDIQDLINGAKPGVKVFTIDSGSDGLQQISNILAAHNFSNLTAIDIVGHGTSGEFTIGSTSLTDGNLGGEAQNLASIGKALVPGGDLMLYGCDVAQGAAGQQFITDLSAATGGAHVAASTQEIGTLLNTTNGSIAYENWTLDASTGTINASTPFTQAAMDSYEGLLVNTTLTVPSFKTGLTVDADNDGGISPGDTVTSEVAISNTTANPANGVTLSETPSGLTEIGNISITPIAVTDTYSVGGNTTLTVDAANGVVANDIDFNGEALNVYSVNGATANVGTGITLTDASSHTAGVLTLAADGSFVFTAAVGYSGSVSFSYTADDAATAGATANAAIGPVSGQTTTVTLNVTAPTWYVATTGSDATGTGTAANPFATIGKAATTAAADLSAGVNNTIMVAAGSYTDTGGTGITLASGEKLIGAGSGSTTFNVSSGNAVTLSSGNTISGIKISDTGSGDGIFDNGGNVGTLTMSDIVVNTNSGEGIALTHGGTVNITGTTNTINSTSGTALDIETTIIGSEGVTFKSISSGAGANDGIILSNTGALGGLTVTGDGSTAGSGGTITGKTGTTGGITNGDGIYLNSTVDVNLAYMNLSNLSFDGIYGQGVVNFSMDHVNVTGANGSAVGEGSVIIGSGQYAGQTQHDGVSGTLSITNSTISGGWYDNLDIFNWSSTADVLLDHDTFNNNNATHGNQNVYIDPDGTSVINATVTNSTWQGVSGGANFFFDVNSTASTGSSLEFKGNTVKDNLGGVSGENGSGTVSLIATSQTGTTTTFDVENNTFTGSNGTALAVANDIAVSTSTTAILNLTINNNTIGTDGTDNSGSTEGGGIVVEPNGGTLNASITNNQVYEFGNNGIDVTAGVGNSSTTENGTFNFEITGNTVKDAGSFGATAGALQDGIYIDGGGANPGFNDNYVMNMTIGGIAAEENTISTAVNGNTDITVLQDDAPHFNLTSENGSTTSFNSYSGPADDGGNQVEAFLAQYNSAPAADDFALPSGDVAPGFDGTLPSAEAPATGPTFGGPTVSGTDTEGSTLSASLAGSTATYQWQESFAGSEYVDIFGSTSSTYVLKESDVGATIRVVETSTYGDGLIDVVASSATATVADNLTLTQPTITVSADGSGTATVGQLLTASTVTSDNSDATITYQWQRNGSPITNADGQTYHLTAADVGDTITVVAKATDPHGGLVTESSAPTGTVSAFTAQSNLSSFSIGTLRGNATIGVVWEATVNPQSNQLIVDPSYTGSVTGTNLTPSSVIASSTVTPFDTLSLEGEIFSDANANGMLDAGDTGINGVSLSVYSGSVGSGTLLESTTTNASGDYDFTGLAAGSYYVQINSLPATFGNSSPVRDTNPNDYLGSRNYGLAASGGVVDTNPITIAYDQPHPTGGPNTYPTDDTTNTLDIGLTKNPVVGGTGNTVDFYQGQAAAIVDSGLTLTDNLNVNGATASISSGFLSGDTLTINGTTNGTIGAITYSFTGSTLTLSGSDTAADYKAALDLVKYSFTGDPTNAGADKTRTVTWSVSDTNSQSSASGTSSTIDVFAQPILAAGAAGTPTVDTAHLSVTADSTLTITDYNGTTIHNASVQITGGVASDQLTISGLTSGSINDGANGTITYSFTGSTLTLTGTDTVADYQSALELVKFSAVSPNSGTRTLNWVVNDQAGGNPNNSATLQTQVDVAFGPEIIPGGTNTFNGGGPAVLLDGNNTLAVTDSQSTTLTGATVQITSGFASGDTLTINGLSSGTINDGANGTITYSYTGSTLTLSGTDTVADYQSALELVKYSFTPTNGDPTTGGGDTTRTLSWTASDSTLTSSPTTSTLDVVHTPPTVTAGAATIYETEGPAVTADSALTVTDPDSAGNLTGATVKISSGFSAGDTLTINGTTSGTLDGAISYSFTGSTLTLSGTDSVSDYHNALDSVVFSSTSTTGGLRTLSWVANDGSSSNGSNVAATSTVNVEIGPQVTAGATATFNGGGPAVTLDGTLTVTDQAQTDLTGATVSISSNFLIGDTLTINGTTSGTINNGGSGTINYSFSGSALTLTGTDTVADYKSALELVQYSFTPSANDPTGGGGDVTRTVSWTVNDSVATSNTATSTLDVVHTAPTVTAGATATFNGGDPAVTLDGTLNVTDPDSAGNLTGATVQITSNFTSGDTLTINGTTSGTLDGAISYSFTGSTLTLTGTDSTTDYKSALDLVKYSFSPSNGDPTAGGGDTSRTISWTVTDGSSSNGTSNTDTSTLTVNHTAPVVTAGATTTFELTGPAVTADGALNVTDADSAGNLTGATVAITSGLNAANDVLHFTNQNGITGSYDAATGVLTLSGTSSVADYKAALDSITFSSTTASTGSRTLSWTVNDGSTSNGSGTDSSTIDLVVGPQVTAGASATFNGGGSAVTLDGALTISDSAQTDLTGATVTISTNFTAGDLLNFTNQNGIAGSYDAVHGILTLTGSSTVANYQTALDSVTYSFNPTNGDPTAGGGDTSRTVTWVATDSVASSTGVTSSLTVNHTAPHVTAGNVAFFAGGGPAVTLDNTLTLSDADSSGNLTGATVSLASGFTAGDLLNFTNQNGITGSYDAVHGVLTLTGTSSVGNYQAALDSITYSFSPSNADPTAGGGDTSRLISWTVTDGSTSNGSGSADSNLIVSHSPPIVTAGGTATFNGGGSAVTLDGTLTVSDADSSGNLTGATVSVGGGFTAGDLLNFTNQNGITGSYDAVHGVLTLSGTSSVGNYQAALDSITYSFSPTNGDPTHGGGDVFRTIIWQTNDGNTSNGFSSSVTSILNVVHTPPTITAGTSVIFDGGGPAVKLDSALLTNDVDSSGNLTGATVSVGSGFLAGDTLNFVNQNGITGTYDAVHGILTLTGTSSIGNYQTALETITYNFSPSNGDPTNSGADLGRTINWTVRDGSTSNGSATATSTVVEAFPTVHAGGTVEFDVGIFNQPVKLDPTVAAFDGINLASATVSLGQGFELGDLLVTNTAGTNIHSAYNALTGVLTLTGNDTVAHYDQVLQHVSFSSAQFNNSTVTVTWQVTDADHNVSAPGTSHVQVKGFFSSIPHGNPFGNQPPDHHDDGNTGNSPTYINFGGDNGGNGGQFGQGGQGVYAIHADINVTIADNGTIDFDIPVGALVATLDGDVVSITATLPDGKPLPDWLHFNAETGQFAGLIPSGDTLTGSIPPGGGNPGTGGNLGGGYAMVPDLLTIEVVATDAKGDIAIIDFTINLKEKGTHHTWNLPRDLQLAPQPIELPQRHALLAPDHGRGAASHHAAAHGFDLGAGHAFNGRAGLSQQLAGQGWRAMHADRMSLLDSLRQATAGHG